MKLLQQVTNQITEGVSLDSLILDEIIAQGDTDNHVEILTLSKLVNYYQNGLSPNSNGATYIDSIDSIKNLPPSDKVKLAQYLKGCMTAEECVFHNNIASSADWIRFVLSHQK